MVLDRCLLLVFTSICLEVSVLEMFVMSLT
jgi:hypothetical protein